MSKELLSYKLVKDGYIYEGSLPTSALEQFDLYTTLLAYWESKSPATWAVVRTFIINNSTVTEESTGIKLDPKSDLKFSQIKLLIENYMTMASNFFTSPQA